MKYLILTTFAIICIVQVNAQTISYQTLEKEGNTPINDSDIKGKFFTLDRSKILSVRVNSSKEFEAKATDADNKDIPLDPSPDNKQKGSAIFSFVPDGAIVNGTFKEGTTINESNIIKINVAVGTKGYYAASTEVKNGIQFYATGFLEEGSQILILKAIGIPFKKGRFNYTIKSAGVNTAVDVDVVGGTPLIEAKIVLDRSGSDCSLYKREGELIAGKELSATDKITVKIKPVNIGHCTISTNPVNGYFYSTILDVVTTNSIDVVLTGRGIPLNEANNDKIVIDDGTNKCEVSAKVAKKERDFTDYVIVAEVTKLVFTDNGDTYTLNLQGDDDKGDRKDSEIEGGTSAYEEAIYSTYGKENLILTPYGLMINTKTPNNTTYIYGGANYVHIFLDEMGNSLITGIPQGMPEVQYVVHVIYADQSAPGGKKVSYGIKTTRASFTGINRIENNRNANAETSSKSKTLLKEYTLVIRTADSEIDFEVYRFENGKQVGGRLNYTIPMTKSFTANISVGLLNTWLKNPSYSLVTDPGNTNANVVKQEEGNNRGIVTVFATLYTSPITLIKYYVNRNQIRKGQKKLSNVKNPVTNGQLYSKNYLYMRPIWERIYPTIGVGISDKIFQNLFFGLNWEFARGGSFFAGAHYGKVNVFNEPSGFEFEKTNTTQAQFDLYSNKDWKIGWAIGASIDFSIIGNLFK